jgi:hypothetical protein
VTRRHPAGGDEAHVGPPAVAARKPIEGVGGEDNSEFSFPYKRPKGDDEGRNDALVHPARRTHAQLPVHDFILVAVLRQPEEFFVGD